MTERETFTWDLIQPQACKNLYAAGWRFSYCEETRFVSAEHPRGGKQSVVEVSLIARTANEANDIGHSIAMMLNGGNYSR